MRKPSKGRVKSFKSRRDWFQNTQPQELPELSGRDLNILSCSIVFPDISIRRDIARGPPDDELYWLKHVPVYCPTS
jgi:hypothetical protein